LGVVEVDWNMISAVTQVLGFGGIIWGLAQKRRSLQTQVALDFYKRFADLADRMPSELRLPAGDARLSSLSEPVRSQVVRSMMSYLNLCCEEYALLLKGRLPQDVWDVSRKEIEANFKQPLWRDAWTSVKRRYESDPEFTKFMERTVLR
jgi:hypothetical protein